MTNLITGCDFSEDFMIDNNVDENTPDMPEVTLLSDNTNCSFPNGSAVATVDGQTDGFLFEWFDAADAGRTTVLYVGSQQNALLEGSYVVRATHLESGCVSEEASISLDQVITDPTFEIFTTNSLCLRTEDGAINQFNGEAFVRFSSLNFVDSAAWFDGNGNRLTYNASGLPVTEGAVNDLSPGMYSVSFRADNGCIYDAEFEIDIAVQVFNFVSVNGDSKNDFFMIDCLDFFPNNEVMIFTRAGQKVWEASNYNNGSTRFEGFSDRGKALPAGTYYYIIDRGDGSDLVQGYLELVR